MAPLSSLISYTLVAKVLPNVAVNTVLLPAQIVADPAKVAVGTGATLILTMLLLTWLHTFNKSLTSARYHLSPTISDAEMVELPPDPANADQFNWSALISHPTITADDPVKVITGMV